MSERLAFARRASGLVRGLGLFDTFGVGFMNQAVLVSVGVTTTLGVGVFLGGNIVVAALVSGVLATIGFTLVWGVLGGSMPRSGGPYVYNSRILHPLVGMAQSFGDAMIWLWWIGTLAPLAVRPGLTMTFQFMGWNGAAERLDTSRLWLFVAASLVNVAGFAFMVLGIRVFARAQRVFMALGMAGALALGVVLSTTSHGTFIARWNEVAGAHHSLSYQAFLDAVNARVVAAGDYVGGLPAHWNWHDTIGIMLAMSWLLAYNYSISFVGGETKHPQRNILWANGLSVAVPAAYMVWIGWALYHAIPFRFLSAASYVDQSRQTLPGYAMPWSSHVYGLMAVINGDRLLLALVGVAYVAFNVWLVALSYLAFPRTLFAWGMDGMGPRWFTRINPRWASPVISHVVCFCAGELLLIVYCVAYTDAMQNIAPTAMEITSVFAVTALAAILFPYRKRAAAVWAASPYARWRFLGLPVVVWGGVVNLVYLLMLLYALVIMKATTTFQWFTISMFVAAWVLGIVWYYVWRARNRAAGVDLRRTYRALPPE